ncbi:hypothetical protein [Arcobacter defluvii]|uniref:Anti-bacteriophage protein A/HamA C-terminal domain-containing protein n=1 Tax=Arcobacter defluvii TaxID=873191 RepID=A0AAE7BCP4_9BACT|nr:hypothetical protein [Arcobacter defluvii]QKF77110.1 hypothetical protein ADFLV_1076 [Arcobacter defluvii]
MTINPLTHHIININNNVNLHILELQEITDEIKSFIDSKIVNITNGTRKIDLKIVKTKLKNFLASKKGSTTEMGAIAEFFIHLYLSTQEYKQECLFFNLEENSIKKGFDGYYSKETLEWIMESKSGLSSTKGISHKSKIKEAYDDLDNKLKGNVSNNPWENAFRHADQKSVNTQQNIVTNIDNFSNEFELGIFKDIKDFNIIPTATIFLDGSWSNDIEKIKQEITTLISTLQYQKLEVICFTKKSLNIFIDYLNLKD